MSDEQTERRRRGRPPLEPDDRSVYVTVVLPSRQYDDLDRQARAARVSIREVIRRKLRDDDDE